MGCEMAALKKTGPQLAAGRREQNVLLRSSRITLRVTHLLADASVKCESRSKCESRTEPRPCHRLRYLAAGASTGVDTS